MKTLTLRYTVRAAIADGEEHTNLDWKSGMLMLKHRLIKAKERQAA